MDGNDEALEIIAEQLPYEPEDAPDTGDDGS